MHAHARLVSVLLTAVSCMEWSRSYVVRLISFTIVVEKLSAVACFNLTRHHVYMIGSGDFHTTCAQIGPP